MTDAHDHLLLESPVIPGGPLDRPRRPRRGTSRRRAAGPAWLPGNAEEAGVHITATGVHQARHHPTGRGPLRWPATLGAAELAELFTEELMRADDGAPAPAGAPCAGVIKVARATTVRTSTNVRR